jgi:hypothetical protein
MHVCVCMCMCMCVVVRLNRLSRFPTSGACNLSSLSLSLLHDAKAWDSLCDALCLHIGCDVMWDREHCD